MRVGGVQVDELLPCTRTRQMEAIRTTTCRDMPNLGSSTETIERSSAGSRNVQRNVKRKQERKEKERTHTSSNLNAFQTGYVNIFSGHREVAAAH